MEDKIMTNTEKVVKHLEITQGIINRLGSNSFLLKSWSMTIIVAAMVLMARYSIQHPFIILVLILPVFGFWILDGYFLWQERLFRKIYDGVRCQPDTDFKMDVKRYMNEPKCSWASAMFSVTLNIFYSIEILLIVFVFSISMR